MDGRLREATTAEISTALGKLFRALPPRKASPSELEESYLIACHKCSKHAIETVVIKLIRGELDGLSKSFAPSPAELSSAIRDEMQFVVKQIAMAQERSQIEDKRPQSVRPTLMADRISSARQRMADERRLRLADGNLETFRSRVKELPAGSTFIAALGAIYGPPGSADEPARAETVAVDEDIQW